MSQPTWIGRTISGRYHIDELLGQGGMSAVYKATDPNLQRVVAIKIIHGHLSGDPDFIKRFEREAAAVAHLRHSNIIQVYDFNHDGDAYYIVFEYVAGVTLQDRLKKLNELHQQMPAGEAMDIAAGLGEAVHYAHKQGLVHRDIKPANVMLNSRNEPILMDFGIAKIVGGAKHTATGATLGTAQYMSPEQIKGEAIDARTDIYALGITLFEMLGGRSPFDADSTMAVMMMHVQNPVPDLRDIRRDVPVDVVMILKKAMAKEPDGRYQNAAQFVEALRNARLNLPSEEVTWAGGGVTAVEDRTMVEPMPPINATQKIDPPKGVTIVDAQPIQEQYVPVLLPSQQYPVRRSSKSKLLASVLVVLVLALIAAGVWFAFFRGPSVEDLLADADALAAAGQYDEAILGYEDILKNIDPANANAQTGLKNTLLTKAEKADQTGDFIQAQAELQRLLQLNPNDANVNLLMAQNMEKQERLAESLPFYEKALTVDENLKPARAGLAWVHYQMGKYDQALTTFTDFANMYPNDAVGYEGQAKSYFELNWYEEALLPLKHWSELEPAAQEPYKMLGLANEQLGNLDEAIKHFSRWAQLSETTNLADVETAYVRIADDQFQLERYEDAIATYQLINDRFANIWALTQMGRCYMRLAQYSQAEESFRKVIGQATELTAVDYQWLGRALSAQEKYAESLIPYEQMWELTTDDASGGLLFADALIRTEDYSRALTILDDITQMKTFDPEETQFWRLKIRAATPLKMYDSAIEAYDAWAKLEPDDLGILMNMAWLYRQANDPEKAVEIYNQVITQDSNFLEAYKELAKVFTELKQYSDAVIAYQNWIRLAPNEAGAYLSLGWLLIAQESFEDAAEMFEKALTLAPNSIDDHLGLGVAYSRIKRCPEAIPHLQFVLDAGDNDLAKRTMAVCTGN
ncbi:MAG: tetratricopeptide repeat protein [Chloroflexi bacterium]|nr:tetratricopeptide repeat protein [Chloroflexota bacterium]MBP7044940.1 tetratricopeptide repeat protein [Chloroflexota bacterium]